jgi:hypothetical protein
MDYVQIQTGARQTQDSFQIGMLKEFGYERNQRNLPKVVDII